MYGSIFVPLPGAPSQAFYHRDIEFAGEWRWWRETDSQGAVERSMRCQSVSGVAEGAPTRPLVAASWPRHEAAAPGTGECLQFSNRILHRRSQHLVEAGTARH